MKKPPEYQGRSTEQIVRTPRAFDVGWHVYQARSWIDYCNREHNINGLYYAALDLRQAIEHVWYVYVVVTTYDTMTRKKYEQYVRSHRKLRQFMEKAQSKYQNLARFTNLCIRQEPQSIRVIEWDITRLMDAHHRLSAYLHFHGMKEDTWGNDAWLRDYRALLEQTSEYLWDELSTAATGVMDEDTMQPEVRDMWEQFQRGVLSEEDCSARLRIAGPALRRRVMIRDSLAK